MSAPFVVDVTENVCCRLRYRCTGKESSATAILFLIIVLIQFGGKKALGKTLVCDIYYLLSSREGDGIYEMGHMHEHDSCLSPPLKPHDLKKEENISLKNANVVHLVHINSAHEHRIFHFKKKNGAWK